MNMNDYQDKTPETAAPYIEAVNEIMQAHKQTIELKPGTSTASAFLRVGYCAGKLCGEAGEVSEEVWKALRDDGGEFTDDRLIALRKELGDVLWYVSQLHNELGLRMERTMEMNLRKLQDRKERDKLRGSGSDR